MKNFQKFVWPIISKLRWNFFLRCLQKSYVSTNRKSILPQAFPLGLVPLFLIDNTKQFVAHFEAEKEISQMIHHAEELILEDRFDEAKKVLNKAVKSADEHQAYGSLSYLCDLLSSLALNEGNLVEAEKLLVQFIEKLLQLGFSESHNSIVKFKLKLARLYQLMGSNDMAEYGYRDCIATQEKKMEHKKPLDDESNIIYITSLFWYGKLLTEQKEFARARPIYRKCLDRIAKAKGVLPSQKMVVLHSIASVSAELKDFDGALGYMFDAIEICLVEDPNNPDLPIYIVQVGLLYLKKGIKEGATFWCETGLSLATHEGNKLAQSEGEKCMTQLKNLKVPKKK